MKHIVYLDFNVFLVNPNVVLLSEKELNRIKKAGIPLAEGGVVTFYDDDKDKSGKLTYLCDDGILEFDKKNVNWFAKFNVDSEYYLKPGQDVMPFI